MNLFRDLIEGINFNDAIWLFKFFLIEKLMGNFQICFNFVKFQVVLSLKHTFNRFYLSCEVPL